MPYNFILGSVPLKTLSSYDLNLYLLIEYEGWTRKCLAGGQDVRTSLHSISTSWARAKYFPFPPDLTQSIMNCTVINFSVCLLSFVSLTLFRIRFRGKKGIKNAMLIKDHFLSLEIHLGTYINKRLSLLLSIKRTKRKTVYNFSLQFALFWIFQWKN